MSASPPNPADFDSLADYAAASNAWVARTVDDALMAKLAAAGARTTDCRHDYSPFDSCPICD